jgi:hypothetical protein
LPRRLEGRRRKIGISAAASTPAATARRATAPGHASSTASRRSALGVSALEAATTRSAREALHPLWATRRAVVAFASRPLPDYRRAEPQRLSGSGFPAPLGHGLPLRLRRLPWSFRTGGNERLTSLRSRRAATWTSERPPSAPIRRHVLACIVPIAA